MTAIRFSPYDAIDRELRKLVDDLELLDRERMSLEQFAKKYRLIVSPRETAEWREE